MNSAAERIAALFETPPNETERLNQLSIEIMQNGDLMPNWRPWWPSVAEVWSLQGKPDETDDEYRQSLYLEAWRALLDIFDDYEAHKAQQ